MSERLPVYVSPKSPRDEIAGVRQEALHVRVTAPPEAGKANEAVCRVVARELGVPKSRVRVVRGEGSRHKQLELEGVTQAQLAALCDRTDAR